MAVLLRIHALRLKASADYMCACCARFMLAPWLCHFGPRGELPIVFLTVFCEVFWLNFGVLECLERSGRKIAVMCPIFVKNAWCGF